MRLDTETAEAVPEVQNNTDSGAENSADFRQILSEGIAAAQNGDRASARMLLFQASGIDPKCEDVWMWLASISDYPEELLIFLGNALDINPENARAIEWRASTRSLLARTFVQRAASAHQEGSAKRAEQCIEQALAYDPECSLAWLWKASLSDDEAQKIGYLEKVLELDPSNADAQTALDSILTERSRSAFNEVRSAATAGRRKKALELVNEFLRTEPNIADAWILRSHLSIGMNEKIESLERALEIDPDNATARSTYDFLRTNVGSSQETVIATEDVTPAPTPEADELQIEEVPEGKSHVFVAEPPAEPELIEMPLDRVFDDPESITDEEPRQHESVEMAYEPTEPVIEISEVYEALAPIVAFEDALTEESSENRYEDTFLETFDAPVSTEVEAEFSFNAEEVNLLDEETQAYGEDEYSYSHQTEALIQTIDPESVPAPEEPLELSSRPEREDFVMRRSASTVDCPYCGVPNDQQSFKCSSCRAALSISDIESLLHNPAADRDVIQNAVTQMEAEWNLRDFSDIELTQLGIGYLNLGEFKAGMKYIQEASRLDPNNVILASQLNALAIRLDEMRRQDEVHEAMPKGKTILVVDDSATVRKLISSKLEKSGHFVICAQDGVEALQRLGEQLPDLVLLDISMPRMDGYEVCKLIRSNPAASDLPVVMISGKDGFFDKVRGRMAGSTGYVTKPFGPETLMKALETYLLPEPVLVD